MHSDDEIRSRIASEQTREESIGSTCLRKVRYAGSAEGLAALFEMDYKGSLCVGVEYHVYPCRACGGWHMGKARTDVPELTPYPHTDVDGRSTQRYIAIGHTENVKQRKGMMIRKYGRTTHKNRRRPK